MPRAGRTAAAGRPEPGRHGGPGAGAVRAGAGAPTAAGPDDRIRASLAERARADRLASLRVQTRVVAGGGEDRLRPRLRSETLARTIPRARLATIPGPGHLPYLESPGRFAEPVLAFLEERGVEAS